MIDERQIYSITHQEEQFAALNSTIDSLLEKTDATWTENTSLCEAYRTSREETAMLKAAVDSLTKTLDKNIATSTLPSPATATTFSTMEEMTMQVS
jgi:hypothetical protein